MAEEPVRHGLDDDPEHDPEKGAVLGGVGGAAVGAVAGALLGPETALAGALIGGAVGAAASGIAVSAVDAVDNDDTVSGLNPDRTDPSDGTEAVLTDAEGHNYVPRDPVGETDTFDAPPDHLGLPSEDEEDLGEPYTCLDEDVDEDADEEVEGDIDDPYARQDRRVSNNPTVT